MSLTEFKFFFLSIFLFFLTTDASPQSVSLLSDEIIIFFKDVNYRNYAQEDGNPTTDQGVRDYLDTVYIWSSSYGYYYFKYIENHFCSTFLLPWL